MWIPDGHYEGGRKEALGRSAYINTYELFIGSYARLRKREVGALISS